MSGITNDWKTIGPTVPRTRFLLLEKQLTEERIAFLRELNAARVALEISQQTKDAALGRVASSMGPAPSQPVGQVDDPLCGSAPQGLPAPPRRFASSVNFTRGESSYNLVGLTSAPSMYNPSSPNAVLPPQAPPQPPELTSMRMLSDALASAQLLEDLKELHQEELKERDAELLELREQLEERFREGVADWNQRLQSTKHEARALQNTFQQERQRVRIEAMASVGDALRQERGVVADLRTQVAALDRQVAELKRHLDDRDAETRTLRVQISTLQQERVEAGLERAESRGALMAMSAEKIALERRVRQLESGRGASGGGGGRRRGSYLVTLEPQSASRRSYARTAQQEDTNNRRASTSGDGLQPAKPANQKHPNGDNPRGKALDSVLDFALDDDMARSIRSSIARQNVAGGKHLIASQ